MALGGNEIIGIGFRKPISSEVKAFDSYDFGEFVFSNGITEQQNVTFQMVSENVAWFGEKIDIKLVPCSKADNSPCNGCVDSPELFAFIDRWHANSSDVTLKEIIEAIGLWKRG